MQTGYKREHHGDHWRFNNWEGKSVFLLRRYIDIAFCICLSVYFYIKTFFRRRQTFQGNDCCNRRSNWLTMLHHLNFVDKMYALYPNETLKYPIYSKKRNFVTTTWYLKPCGIDSFISQSNNQQFMYLTRLLKSIAKHILRSKLDCVSNF
jgi:hypothetical protein